MNDTIAQFDRKGAQAEAAHNADQTEWKAVRLGSSPIDEGVRDDRIADPAMEFPDDELSSVGGPELRLERLAGETYDEIQRRKSIMGESYPFVVAGNALKHMPSTTKVYEFCLSFSFIPTVSQKPFTRLQVAFERLVRDVLMQFLGKGSQGYRTGHPSDDHEHRPKRIKAVIEHLSSLAGEWNWNPEDGFPNDPTYRSQKDLGLDVVVWKKTPDNRKGYLCCIGQCACGLTDWESKFYDITVEKLGNWIRPITIVPPIRVFAVPFHIPNEPYFGSICKQAGLTWDRARLAMLAERAEDRDTIREQAIEKYDALLDLAYSAPLVDRQGPRRRRRKGAAARRSQSSGSDA